MANELHDNVKFTLELPTNNQVACLDAMVFFDKEVKQLRLLNGSLYKANFTACVLQHGKVKHAILIEAKRAIACYSELLTIA